MKRTSGKGNEETKAQSAGVDRVADIVVPAHLASDIHKPAGSYHHGHLREALMAAAVARLAESSASDISIRALAAEAGTSHVAAYRHFSSRRHLLAAVGEEGFRMFNAHMQKTHEAHAADFSVVEALAGGAAEYVRFALTNPGHFRAMFHKELPPRDDFPDYCAQALAAFQSLMEAVAPLLGSQSDTDSICSAATSLWSIVHGVSVLQLEGQFDSPDMSFAIDAPTVATNAVRAWALGYQLQRSQTKR